MKAATFSTSNLPASQQFEAWMGWFDGVFDVVPHASPRTGFRAQSESWQINGCMLSRVRAPAIRVERNTTRVRRNPLHHWIITLSHRATSWVSTGNTTLSVPPGTPVRLVAGR
jgi:hypothetical protein